MVFSQVVSSTVIYFLRIETASYPLESDRWTGSHCRHCFDSRHRISPMFYTSSGIRRRAPDRIYRSCARNGIRFRTARPRTDSSVRDRQECTAKVLTVDPRR